MRQITGGWKATISTLVLSGAAACGGEGDGDGRSGSGGADDGTGAVAAVGGTAGSVHGAGDGGGSGDGGGKAPAGGAVNTGGSGTDGGHDGGGASSGGGLGSGGAMGTGGAASLRPTACKRGVGYGYHSAADLRALSPGVSWWYNWAYLPDEKLRDGAYLEERVEYVPMIWGEGSDTDDARHAIVPSATALLGFNEPNFGEQANLSATEAAALWPELETVADALDLRLVSPAVNYCGGNCQDTDPFRYLEEFFDACEGCRVDAVAIHIYVGCSPAGDDKAEWLIGHVENYKSRFSQPLWLTEFACDDAQNPAQQREFLEDAVAYLEAEPRIERYAWFAGRANNVGHVDLLGADGELTELGQAYVEAPQNPECTR